MTATQTQKQNQSHTDLAKLQPNAYVDGTYSIFNPQVGATRNGKPPTPNTTGRHCG